MATKEDFICKLPPSMQKLIDYATLENLSLQQVEIEILQYITEFGSALILTRIPDEVEVSKDTPKIEVIPGCDVLDGESFYDKESGLDRFKRVVYYKQEYKFNTTSNSYELPKIYVYVRGLDEDGLYYEAKMEEQNYHLFNFAKPLESQNICISLSFPKWFKQLEFIPAVYVNKENLKLEWKESPIQNLIETSLSIFQMTADMRFLMHQQSSATLIIAGTDLEAKAVRTGVGNVINLVDTGSKAEYISPSVAGLQAMQTALNEQHKLAQSDLLTLTDAGANSSGEALALRISDKTYELIGLISIIGKAIQRELEIIGILMGENIDLIEFVPYTDFGKLTTEEENKEN